MEHNRVSGGWKSFGGSLPAQHPLTGCRHGKLPWSPLPLELVHESGGEEGRTTGAKADFCFTAADTMLAGEKEKTPEEEEQLEGREVEEAIVGLDGTTGVAVIKCLNEERRNEDKKEKKRCRMMNERVD